MENLSRVNVIAFDKTGTLTGGHPVVTDLIAYQGRTNEEFLQIAASIEAFSTHPIAGAVVKYAESQAYQQVKINQFQSHTGWGVEAFVNDERWKIGKPSLIPSEMMNPEIEAVVLKLEDHGKTVIVAHNDQGVAGVIALQDRIRPQTLQTVKKLKELGVEVAMLTGDQQKTAEAIAHEAGIEKIYANLLPEDKLTIVKQLKNEYQHVAMVGDGVNDAPALATATVGIAMGAGGSDAALETADLVLMNDDLEKLHEAIVLGRRARFIVKQNMIFAIAVILILVTLNFASGIALPEGVVGHEGSTILVILNGLRLLR